MGIYGSPYLSNWYFRNCYFSLHKLMYSNRITPVMCGFLAEFMKKCFELERKKLLNINEMKKHFVLLSHYYLNPIYPFKPHIFLDICIYTGILPCVAMQKNQFAAWNNFRGFVKWFDGFISLCEILKKSLLTCSGHSHIIVIF